MSQVTDEEIKRWAARRKSAMALEIIQGETTVTEAGRQIAIAAENEGETLASASSTFQRPCTPYPSPHRCRDF